MSKNETSIQQRMSELSEIVAWFQSADFRLEEATKRMKAAEVLAASIETDLLELKNDIQVISQRFDKDV